MHRYLTSAVTVFLLLVSSCSLWAHKIEVDPNTPDAAEQKVDNSNVDKRLAQKITYTSTDKRLHSVMEDLSSMSGVTIRCGSSDDDWKVRDLPVIVCCKDFQLGKLLKAIAESTHMLLSSYSVDGTKSYRVWWDKTRQKQLDDFYKASREAGLKNASQEWDSWVQLATTFKSNAGKEIQVVDEQAADELAQAKEFAGIAAILGSEAKQRIFAGETVCVSAQDINRELADSVTKLYRMWRESSVKRDKKWLAEHPEDMPEGYESGLDKELTDEDLKQVCLSICITRQVTPQFYTSLNGPSGSMSPAVFGTRAYSDDPADPIKLPEFPLSGYLKSLPGIASESWNGLENPSQFTLPKPDKKEPGFSDVVKAVAEASGYAIVCEDFFSQKRTGEANTRLFGRKTTLDVSLAELGWSYSDTPRWYVDEQSKLILGYPERWYKHHDALVQETFVDFLHNKLDGNGLQLEDLLPTLRLTTLQLDDWLYYDTTLGEAYYIHEVPGKSLWSFYDSLSQEDKALARSKSGLPLAKFNSKILTDVLARASRIDSEDPDLGVGKPQCCGGGRPETPEIPTEPEAVSKLVFYVRDSSYTDTISAQMRDALENDPEVRAQMEEQGISPEAIKKMIEDYATSAEAVAQTEPESRFYNLQLVGEGVDVHLAHLPCSFPLYSEERKEQLQKEKQKTEQAPAK